MCVCVVVNCFYRSQPPEVIREGPLIQYFCMESISAESDGVIWKNMCRTLRVFIGLSSSSSPHSTQVEWPSHLNDTQRCCTPSCSCRLLLNSPLATFFLLLLPNSSVKVAFCSEILEFLCKSFKVPLIDSLLSMRTFAPGRAAHPNHRLASRVPTHKMQHYTKSSLFLTPNKFFLGADRLLYWGKERKF